MRASRHATRLFAAMAMMAAPIVVTATAAPAKTALPAPPVIRVVMGNGPGDMTVDTPLRRQAGRVTFDVSTTITGDDERDFQIARLNRGTSAQELINLVTNGLEREGQPDLGALRRFNTVTQLLGGAVAFPGHTASVTLTLYPGTYYLLDTTGPAAAAIPAAKVLTVRGPVRKTAFPKTSATIDMRAPHVFAVSGQLPADGNVLLRNSDDEPHFVDLEPVQPGTTDAAIQAVFDKAMAGDESAFDQFPGVDAPGASSGTISPGFQNVFTYHLTPGTYALMCFWPDQDTGAPHAFMGMHQVVTLR